MVNDPQLLALKQELQEGRSRMRLRSSESAYAQQDRSLNGTRSNISGASSEHSPSSGGSSSLSMKLPG